MFAKLNDEYIYKSYQLTFYYSFFISPNRTTVINKNAEKTYTLYIYAF